MKIDPMINSAFHLSKVNQMSIINSCGLKVTRKSSRVKRELELSLRRLSFKMFIFYIIKRNYEWKA